MSYGRGITTGGNLSRTAVLRELEKAGALIAAEIDRLLRKEVGNE